MATKLCAMKIFNNHNTAEWNIDNETASIQEPYNIHQVLYSNELGLLVVLISEERLRYINLYSKQGRLIKNIQEPEHMTLNCIGSHIKHDVAVLVKTYEQGWVDWWYSINPISGQLESIGEGR